MRLKKDLEESALWPLSAPDIVIIFEKYLPITHSRSPSGIVKHYSVIV
jgi:hypothetical protein